MPVYKKSKHLSIVDLSATWFQLVTFKTDKNQGGVHFLPSLTLVLTLKQLLSQWTAEKTYRAQRTASWGKIPLLTLRFAFVNRCQ